MLVILMAAISIARASLYSGAEEVDFYCQVFIPFHDSKGQGTKMDEFSQNFQRRGGGHFQSKNLYCRFWALFGLLPKKLQYTFPKMRGGGQRPNGFFSENSYVLIALPAPNTQLRINLTIYAVSGLQSLRVRLCRRNGHLHL